MPEPTEPRCADCFRPKSEHTSGTNIMACKAYNEQVAGRDYAAPPLVCTGHVRLPSGFCACGHVTGHFQERGMTRCRECDVTPASELVPMALRPAPPPDGLIAGSLAPVALPRDAALMTMAEIEARHCGSKDCTDGLGPDGICACACAYCTTFVLLVKTKTREETAKEAKHAMEDREIDELVELSKRDEWINPVTFRQVVSRWRARDRERERAEATKAEAAAKPAGWDSGALRKALGRVGREALIDRIVHLDLALRQVAAHVETLSDDLERLGSELKGLGLR